MFITDKMDEFGKPAWIAAVVLGFMTFWPLGLGVLLFLAFSGRLRIWKAEKVGRWHNMSGRGCGWGRQSGAGTSGNAAFDEYRAETLRRLEEEQKEFLEYLDRLRQAKDKTEFDQFMADRRRPPAPPVASPA